MPPAWCQRLLYHGVLNGGMCVAPSAVVIVVTNSKHTSDLLYDVSIGACRVLASS